MARASFTGTYGHNMQLEILANVVDQNNSGNYSTINVQVKLITNQYAALWGAGGKELILDVGGTVKRLSVDASIERNQTKTIWNENFRIQHNEDGSKTVEVSARLNAWHGGYDWSAVGFSLPLAKIPRASLVTVPSGGIGSTVTISIDRRLPGVKHTLRYIWGSKEKTIASNVDTSFNWTIPKDFADDIPNASSGFGTIYCDTYQGSTRIGTTSTTFTATIGGASKPTLTGLTLTDTNAVTQNLIPQQTHFVSVLSQIKVTFNGANGSNGSKITGYYAEIIEEKQTISVNNGVFQPIMANQDKQVTIRARVSDSRGQWSDWKETKVTILSYFSPSLRFDVARKGERLDILGITRWAKIAPLTVNGSQKNTMKLSFKVARVGTTNYTADTGQASGEWTSLSELRNSMADLGGRYPADRSFIVLGRIEDKFTFTEFQVTVSTNKIVWSYDQQGIGVNKYRENGALDVNGFIYTNSKPIQHHKLTESDGGLIQDIKMTDLNDYLTTGFYEVLHTIANYPIKPATGKNQTASLEVLTGLFGIQQTLTTMAGRVFRRSILGSNYGPWVEYQSVQEQTSISTDIHLPYGIEAKLFRKGDVVTLSIKRNIVSIGSHENAIMNEAIPSGYRPAIESHLIMALNQLTTVKGTAVLTIAIDGKTYLTNNNNEDCVVTGTITYLTNDPYPGT